MAITIDSTPALIVVDLQKGTLANPMVHDVGLVVANSVALIEAFRAKGWPIGEARVTIDVKPRGRTTVVRLQEEAVAGPGRFIPAPMLNLGLHWRNTETLHRLAYLAEGLSRSD